MYVSDIFISDASVEEPENLLGFFLSVDLVVDVQNLSFFGIIKSVHMYCTYLSMYIDFTYEKCLFEC